jgi:uncharacterized protein
MLRNATFGFVLIAFALKTPYRESSHTSQSIGAAMNHLWTLGVLGGVLIGLSASMMLWLNGRIAGISGIVFGAARGAPGDRGWRYAFLIGLLVAGGITLQVLPHAPPREGFPVWLLLLAGMLVGFGTSMGNGCTSGHGVCGLGRLSKRSLVAVLTFMLSAMITVWIVAHLKDSQ